jgi:hypothetical protein
MIKNHVKGRNMKTIIQKIKFKATSRELFDIGNYLLDSLLVKIHV